MPIGIMEEKFNDTHMQFYIQVQIMAVQYQHHRWLRRANTIQMLVTLHLQTLLVLLVGNLSSEHCFGITVKRQEYMLLLICTYKGEVLSVQLC